MTINAAQSIAVSSAIPDNGGPTASCKTGPASLTLSGPLSYTGNTYLNEGTLVSSRRRTPPTAGIHGLGNLTKSGTATLTLIRHAATIPAAPTITGGGLCVNERAGQRRALAKRGLLSGSGTIGGNVTATGGAIGLSSSGISGFGQSRRRHLLVGQTGGGQTTLDHCGGLNVTGAGVLAASPKHSATIIGSVNYSSSAQYVFRASSPAAARSVLTLDAAAGTLTLSNTASSTYGGIVVQAGTLKSPTRPPWATIPSRSTAARSTWAAGRNSRSPPLAGSGGFIETSSGRCADVQSRRPRCDYSGSIVNGRAWSV